VYGRECYIEQANPRARNIYGKELDESNNQRRLSEVGGVRCLCAYSVSMFSSSMMGEGRGTARGEILAWKGVIGGDIADGSGDPKPLRVGETS
jgi:hypothetical protein